MIIYLNGRDSSVTIRGVDVTNHLDSCVLELGHVRGVRAVHCAEWPVVGVDNRYDFL